ncbi:MAG TPA: hypothetical protein VMT91_02530 [Anaerolineales bacterium]|nr:hypothetical protein [Anaerolineales bacterium]
MTIPSGRKRGAPLGNTNALKHGFYTIKPEVLTRLDQDVKGQFNDEIDALRDLVDTTMTVFSSVTNPTLEQCQVTLRAVSQAFDTMKSLYLSQRLLYNNTTTIEQAIQELSTIPTDID